MDLLIGSLSTVVFFLCLIGAYKVGQRHIRKATAQQLSEKEELEEALRIKGIENVMNFDYDVAIGRRAN